MKSTGIIRRLDDIGRIVLPREIRRIAKLSVDDPMEFFVEDDGAVLLKKYNPGLPVLNALARLEDEIRDDLISEADQEELLKLTAGIRQIVEKGGYA